MHDKPWRNEELEKSEEALPRLKGVTWKRSSQSNWE